MTAGNSNTLFLARGMITPRPQTVSCHVKRGSISCKPFQAACLCRWILHGAHMASQYLESMTFDTDHIGLYRCSIEGMYCPVHEHANMRPDRQWNVRLDGLKKGKDASDGRFELGSCTASATSISDLFVQ